MATSDDELRKQLSKVGRRRALAIRNARAASDELRDLVLEADKRGIPRTEIADEAHLSRQAIYNILRGRE